MGWGTASKAYTRLTAAIDCLKANLTEVKLEDGRKGFAAGSLVCKFG